MLVRSSVTAKDLFKGRNSIALALVMHSRAIVLTIKHPGYKPPDSSVQK
ncbi:hypothetical protein [Microcoleus sp. B7-D4]